MSSSKAASNPQKTDHKRMPASSVHGSEIEALGGLVSKSQIADRLRDIAGCYGKVLSVTTVQKTTHEEMEKDLFFIRFDKANEALLASRALDGLLYGFTTLAVSVSRNGKT